MPQSRRRVRPRTQATFPIIDSSGRLILHERRKGDRRSWAGTPRFPLRDPQGGLILRNRRRRVDRRLRDTVTINDPTGPHLPKILLDTGFALFEIHEDGGALTIGRGKENDIIIDGDAVSRQHACILRDGDRFVLVDDSRNGTAVLGRDGKIQVLHDAETALEERGLIRLGRPIRGAGDEGLIRYAVIRDL